MNSKCQIGDKIPEKFCQNNYNYYVEVLILSTYSINVLNIETFFYIFKCCITVDTVCALLATAERYIQYKCTKFLLQKVLSSISFEID